MNSFEIRWNLGDEDSILDMYDARATICPRCKLLLVRMGDGRCLECNRIKNREFYQRNKERLLVKNRAWIAANRAKVTKMERERRSKKRDVINEQARRRREAVRLEGA